MRYLSKFISLGILSLALMTSANAAGVNLPDFTQLVEDNHLAVVNISTSRKAKSAREAIPPQFRGLPDEFLRHFFGMDPRQEQEQRKNMSVGSGFIISSDGYILTNHHVIDEADEITVRLNDRQEYKAELIGSDAKTDVALLKVQAKNLPQVKIGNSENLKVGSWVLAIGAPFGLDYTVTAGIVSAKGRNLPDDTYVPFIQTDVAINPGNSGGPLINLAGEVIGINAQIYTRSGGFMGLSFAIPIEIAMNVVEQLKANGQVDRGFLGVQVQEVTSDLAKSFKMDKPRGALIAQVYADTPAAKLGLEAGDIIIKFNGKEILKSTDLAPAVGMSPLGAKVPLEIIRQGKLLKLSVKLEALTDEKTAPQQLGGAQKSSKLAAYLEPISKDDLTKLNIPFGVGVAKLDKGLAQQSGIQQGDIIVSINFQPVRSAKEADAVLSKASKGESLPVRIVRQGGSIYLALEIK